MGSANFSCDVDFENKCLLIRTQKAIPSKNQVKWHPKHFKERKVPMNDTQIRILKRWIKEMPELNHPLIWCGRGRHQTSEKTFDEWAIKQDGRLLLMV